MGTSSQHQPHHTLAPTAVSAAGGGVSTLCRRDSGGSGGTNFLTNNNVTVRGRCSPVTSCGHVDSKKKEGGETKVVIEQEFRRLDSLDCSVGGDDEKKEAASDAKDNMDASASTPCATDKMEVDEDCSDALSAATTQGYTSSEDECITRNQADSMVATVSPYSDKMDHNHGSPVPGLTMSRLAMSYPALPFEAQPAWNNFVTSGDHVMTAEGVVSHCSAPATFASPIHLSPAVAAASISTAVPSAKALQSMQLILNLNQSAVNHFLTSTVDITSSGEAVAMVEDADVDWALDDLHRAEWVRCHLVDELSSASANTLNVVASRNGKRSSCGSVKMQSPRSAPSGLSSSFTNGTATTADSRNGSSSSMARPQQVRRVGSFGTTTPSMARRTSSLHQRNSMLTVDNDNDVARTSYIYQRMDFDEGMHSFASLESIDPDAFWIVNNNNVSAHAPAYEMSPVVEATLVFNVGQVHRRKGDLDAASKCYDQALDILEQFHNCYTTMMMYHNYIEKQYPIMIPILHNIGQLQYRRGDIRMAMETYERALQCARDMYGDRHPHVASALNCLGVLHYHDANSSGSQSSSTTASSSMALSEHGQEQPQEQPMQQPLNKDDHGDSINTGDSSEDKDSNNNKQQQQDSTQQAMSLFQTSLSIRISTLGPTHVDVATVLNNIGRIHVQLDEFDRALSYYEDALRIRRDTLGADSLDYAATAFNAGQSFHQKGELEKAAELYHEFLRVALMKFGHGHRDVAVVLSGIAQIHQEKREFDKAQELYEASLCAGKAALGEDHSEIAMLLNRMGNFHFERERLDEALMCYRRGLRIERRVLPADHPNIVVTLSNLGEIYRQRNEWDEAAKMYGDCLDILRKKHENEDNIDVASTLSTIGLIHDQRGDTCLSLHYLQDALLMRRRLLGNDHLDVSATLVYIGTILYRKRVFSVAIELFSESLRIRQSALGNDHRDVAFVLYNIALVHQQRGCYEEAIEAYGETLRIERLVLGEKHRDVSMTLFKLGEVNKAAGDLEAALKCFTESLDVERSLSMTAVESTSENDDDTASATSQDTADTTPASSSRQQQQPSADHAAMARALNEIGNIHLARGEVVPMMEAFNEASRLYRSAGLSPSNVVVSGHLYALEFSCPEAAPAA